MLSGLRSACTIRFRCMCRTLNIRMPKTSAASEKVRSLSCSQALSVSLPMAAAVRAPSASGGGPMSSISISRTTRVQARGAAAAMATVGSGGRLQEAPATASPFGAALLDVAGIESGPSQASSSCQSNPQLSPKQDGVCGYSLGLSDALQLSLGLRGHLPLPRASRRRSEWAQSLEASRWGPPVENCWTMSLDDRDGLAWQILCISGGRWGGSSIQ
mmetsp:Transcript_59652/g.177489  ORF Transcript_59652/g.177489 Transcript_59652/m.177489 type:complete len:216 (-) Transcript_59652:359-1006(-)